MAGVQGAFYGVNLPAGRIEGLIAANVARRHITDVAAVYDLKWWDYRRLAPGHSFMLFAHHYYRSYRTAASTFLAARKRSGFRTAAPVTSALVGVNEIQFSSEEVWDRDTRHIVGLWKAMLTADALGIPYENYCQLANRIAIERAWTHLPRPPQLYSDMIGALVWEAWETQQSERLRLAKHPMFALDNYAALPVQEQYREWLMDQIDRMERPLTALANVVYRTPQLPEAIAQARFSASIMSRARSLSG